MTSHEIEPKGMPWRWSILLLVGVSLLLLFWGLGDRGLWGSEGRWAEVSRQMLSTGDFFHPQIGNEPYFDKPLLTYWFITAISAVSGILNEWIVRLPSAIFGLIALWATVTLGRQLWSDRVGLLAGWFLLTSYGFLFWSRTGAADTENLAVITLCILWYWTRRDKPGFITFQVFYLIAFLGALTKGLTAVIVPIAAVFPAIIINKQWKHLLRPTHFLALAIGLGVYLAPFIYATMAQPENYHSSGLALVFQENFQRYFHATDHKNPIYTYVYSVPMLLLPWAPLFIAGLVGLLPMWKRLDDKTRWLMLAIAAIFLFFTLSGSRRDYYILPITPLCTLLMAVFFTHIVDGKIDISHFKGVEIQKYLFVGVIAFEIILPFILVFLKAGNNLSFFVQLGISGIILGALAVLVPWWINRKYKRTERSPASEMWLMMTGMITVAAITLGGFFCWQQNIVDHFRTEHPFLQEVKAKTADWPGNDIAFFPKNDAKQLFYLDKKKTPVVLRDDSDWDSFFSGQTPKLLVMQNRYEADVPQNYKWLLQKQPDIKEKIQPWDSVSSRRKKWCAWIIQGDSEVSRRALNDEEKNNNAD